MALPSGFLEKNHNFLKAPLIDNPCISRGMLDNRRVDNKCVDHTVIGRYSYDFHKETWLNLKVCDMLTNGIIISMPELTVRLGFDITVNTYLALRRATSHALVKYGNNNASDGTVTSIDEFLAPKGKGAKKQGWAPRSFAFRTFRSFAF